jgi:hypothetical protein
MILSSDEALHAGDLKWMVIEMAGATMRMTRRQ